MTDRRVHGDGCVHGRVGAAPLRRGVAADVSSAVAVRHVPPRPASRRPLRNPARGFTLIEMLVSLAVLSLALTIIGVVFTVATKTTRQAAAYSEAYNRVRQFTEQLEEDLAACEPSQSVLVLVGRTQAAALTQDDLDARRYHRVATGDPRASFDHEYATSINPAVDGYSDPRADLMMFFTNRAMVSQSPPPNPPDDTFGAAARNGARFSPIRVVYGHAALGDVKWNSGEYVLDDVNVRHIEEIVGGGSNAYALSSIPADQWHLSRNALIVQSDSFPGTVPGDVQLSTDACDRMVNSQWALESVQQMPGDAAYFNLPLFLELLGPDFPSPYDYYAARQSPYSFPGSNPYGGSWNAAIKNSIYSLMYKTCTAQPTNHHVATVVENPPAALQSNMGVHMLPGCAWFQVEFLMPEDPRNSLDYAPPDIAGVSQRYDMPRWTEVEAGKTYVFVPDTQENRDSVSQQVMTSASPPYVVSRPLYRLATFGRLDQTAGNDNSGIDVVGDRRVRMWPYAIRVTVRVYDPQGRLPEPIVRSVVHRFD